MKRQGNKISDFYLKARKTDTESEPNVKNEIFQQVLPFLFCETTVNEDDDDDINKPSSSKSTKEVDMLNINSDIPDCWSTKQADEFREKYSGLRVIGKKLGCDICAEVESIHMKGAHVSKEWRSYSIIANGRNKMVQQASLRKKIKEHFSSKAHQICELRLKISEKYMNSTRKIFNTVYSMAKRNRPYSDIEPMIELQIKNGLELEEGLHSPQIAVKIVDHIAKDIKKQIFGKIVERNLKICIIIDEVSTVSYNPVLIIFIKVENFSSTIFVDLVELSQGEDAETIYVSVLQSLHSVGFHDQYLKKNLIAFCSNGASEMLRRKSEMSIRMKSDFPEIIIWNCLSHRLQLILDDSIGDIKRINHFKSFIDEINNIFNLSYKNQMALLTISNDLGTEILKIDTVFDSRWVACSLKAVIATWRSYPALYHFFSTNKKFSELAHRLSNVSFMRDLALMIDILEEIALLSDALQGNCVNILRAEQLIKRTIKAFEFFRENNGTYEKKINETISSEEFQGIDFIEDKGYASLPRQELLNAVITNMKLRLMDCAEDENHKIRELVKIVDPDSWNVEEVVVPWKDAEEKLPDFCKVFRHKIPVNDFRDYVENVTGNYHKHFVPETIQKAKNIITTIAVSSEEVKRGFSVMNSIYSDIQNNLEIKNVGNLLVINLIGLPLALWDCSDLVRMWLINQVTANDTNVIKYQTSEQKHDENTTLLWKYLSK